MLAGMPAASEPVAVPDPGITDTDRLLASAGLDPDTITALHNEGIVA